jgi:8-oxo-dGTP diphosphatase
MKALIVAAAIIENNGKFLITQRLKDKHMGFKWEFPGGKLEKGEDAGSCLRREIREELDIDIEVGAELMVVEHQYPDRKVILKCHWCRFVQGEAKTLGCHSFKWVSAGEMKDYDFSAADLPAVKYLVKHFKLG